MTSIALLLLLSQSSNPSPTPVAAPPEAREASEAKVEAKGLAEAPVEAKAPAAGPQRQFTVHGFRSPSIGVEFRQGFLGFHVGLFPLIADTSETGESRTTWFVKTGVSAYFLRFDLGSGRPSSLFASLSLMQGLNHAWDVNRSVGQGTGLHGEVGVLWAASRGLDVRLGVGVLVGLDGRVKVHPTPGISWSTVF